MRQIIAYLSNYFLNLSPRRFFIITLIVTALTIVNYTFGLNSSFAGEPSFIVRFLSFFALYFFTFTSAYFVTVLAGKNDLKTGPFFFLLLVVAPAVFAVKVSLRTSDMFSHVFLGNHWKRFFEVTVQWPLKAVIVSILLYITGRAGNYEQPLFGVKPGGSLKPYFIMVAAMLPLLLLAGLQPDFQKVYPKLQLAITDSSGHNWLQTLLFELSYGVDFFTIELFFRGFLIVAFIKYAGIHAVLPMAAFYCTIHFGKPLAECISSFFGGLVLGAVVFHTRSIWGGLVVHLGIAWMMELIGYLL